MTTPDLTLPEQPNPPYHYRIEIPKLGKRWLNSNDRKHFFAQARDVEVWRGVAAWRARGLPTIPSCRIVCELRFADKRVRDGGNWYPTGKAVVDGLRDAKVLIDDDSTRVIGPDMRVGPTVTRGGEALIVHIWPLEES